MIIVYSKTKTALAEMQFYITIPEISGNKKAAAVSDSLFAINALIIITDRNTSRIP